MKIWIKLTLSILILSCVAYFFYNIFLEPLKRQSVYEAIPVKRGIDTIYSFNYTFKEGDTVTNREGFQYIIIKKLK